MNLWREEWRRLFLKRKLIPVLFILLALELCSLCFSLAQRGDLDEASREVYLSYMEHFAGEVTEEKAQQIEDVIDQRQQLNMKKTALEQEYAAGTLDAQTYRQQMTELRQKTVGSIGFQRFVEAYRGVSEETPILADTTAWDVLFGNGGIDIFPVLGLLYLVLALTVGNEESGVNRLLFTTPKGKRALIHVQMFTALGTAVLFSAAIYGGKLLFAVLFFDLSGFSLPLRAAEIFVQTPWALTLGEGYFYLSLIKTAGGLLLTLLMLLVGRLCRSSLYTAFISLIAVYVPAYMLSDRYERFYLPLPSSLLSANGYFSALEEGSVYVGENGEMLAYSFSEGQMLFFFAALFAFLLLLYAVNALLWIKRRSAV